MNTGVWEVSEISSGEGDASWWDSMDCGERDVRICGTQWRRMQRSENKTHKKFISWTLTEWKKRRVLGWWGEDVRKKYVSKNSTWWSEIQQSGGLRIRKKKVLGKLSRNVNDGREKSWKLIDVKLEDFCGCYLFFIENISIITFHRHCSVRQGVCSAI